MYNTIDTDLLTKAGDFILSDVVLTSYISSNGNTSKPKQISVKSLMTELNIYESIDKKSLSGNIVLTDAQNIPNHLPLTGFERIEFKLFTPGTSRGFDFTHETGHPMHIYKISERQGATPRAQVYVLHFVSKELIVNEQKRISRAVSGSLDNMILSFIRNDLESTKNVIMEESKGLRKYVIPRLRPYQAIDFIRKRTDSLRYANKGFLFYENSLGLHCKSLESHLATSGVAARPVVAKYKPTPANVRQGDGNRDVVREMQQVSNFRIKEQYDTLKSLRSGVYNSKAIAYDCLNKKFTTTHYDYLAEYGNSFHTEHDGVGGKTDNKGILPFFNYDKGKTFSSFPEGSLYVFADTEKLHNDFENDNDADITPKRIAQRFSFESMVLNLSVPGFTGVGIGDLITFEMPIYEPADYSELDIDPYMSGRYLIRSIRHTIKPFENRHLMYIDCMKDSVRLPYPEETNDTQTDYHTDTGQTLTQEELDNAVINTDTGDNILS